MSGNDRQNQKFPRHRLLRCRRPTYSPVSTCNRTTFSATIQLRQSDQSDQYQLQKNILQLRRWSDSQLRFHPRRLDESSSVETQGVAAGYKSLASPSPFFDPNRNTAAGCLKAAVGPDQPRKSAIAAKASQPDTKSVASPPLFRPQSDHGPNLAQSYSRNNRNTMRAET